MLASWRMSAGSDATVGRGAAVVDGVDSGVAVNVVMTVSPCTMP